MRRRTATTCRLLPLVAAAFLVLLPLLSSCVASAHRLPRHAPVLLLGGGAGAWERGGRSPAQTTPREGRELAATARRLGQRTPLGNPPSPKPHGMMGRAMPLPRPPPPPPYINE